MTLSRIRPMTFGHLSGRRWTTRVVLPGFRKRREKNEGDLMTNLTDKHRVLGILACSTNHHPPFAERAYYEQLTKVGKSLGVAIVVFSPRRIDWRTRQVHGYVYSPALKQWYAHTTALPSVIYDRCRYVSAAPSERYHPL